MLAIGQVGADWDIVRADARRDLSGGQKRNRIQLGRVQISVLPRVGKRNGHPAEHPPITRDYGHPVPCRLPEPDPFAREAEPGHPSDAAALLKAGTIIRASQQALQQLPGAVVLKYQWAARLVVPA